MLHSLLPSTPLLRWVLLALALWALLALSLALLKAWLRSARGKGQHGEWRVRRMLRRGLNRSEYVALHNITLATPEGSTQIDHVVLSRFGIFVTQGAGCVPFIRSFTQPVLAAAQVHALVQQLQARRLPPTRATHRAHVQQLQKRHPPPAQPPATPPFSHPLRKIVKKRKNLA